MLPLRRHWPLGPRLPEEEEALDGRGHVSMCLLLNPGRGNGCGISTTATGVAATTPPYLAPVSPEMRYRYMDICYPRDRHMSTPAIMLETTFSTASMSTTSTRS